MHIICLLSKFFGLAIFFYSIGVFSMMLPKNYLSAKVAIKGMKAILWHRFGSDVLSPERKEKSGVAGNDPCEWKKTVLKN